MSVATEITRLQNAKASIKSSIEAKGVTVPSSTTLDGYSTLIDSIPSGGATINGTLVSKEIQSGSVAKGDFVKRGDYNIEDRVSSSSQMVYGTNVSATNENNIFDNNDDTYATIKASGANSLNAMVQCKSRTDLNIPATAILKSISSTFKFRFPSSNSNVASLVKLPVNTAYNLEGSPITQDTSLTTYTLNFQTIGDLWDTNQYRVRFYCSQVATSVYLYYVTFAIAYEYDGQIKTITSNADTIIGIANENGNQGDTIQIYIPNEE